MSEDSARIVAQNFFWAFAYDKVGNLEFDKIVAELVHIESRSGINLYYIFNIPSFHGYVIVTADNRLKPVIGCNTNKIYEHNSSKPPAYEYWMRERAESIYSYVSNLSQSDKPDDIHPAWSTLLKTNRSIQSRTTTIGPLLTSCWSQGCHFNALCPYDLNGPCDSCKVGCIAVAMAQIMHYWNFPGKGNGDYGYYPPNYPYQYANFGNTLYNWVNMPWDLANSCIAELCYHCGVSTSTKYGPGESGASNLAARYAYVNYFGYSQSATIISRAGLSDEDWNNLIKGEISATPPRPIQYGGDDQFIDGSSHAWVIDGYSDATGIDLYHFAWGWLNCLDNDWWTLEDNDHYNYFHEAVMIIMPSVINAPGNVSATDGAYTNKVTISWTAVPYASHYKVYRSTTSESLGTAISEWIEETTFDDNTCTPGVTYYYRIKAASSSEGHNISDQSDYNDGWRKLSPPANVAASDGTYSDHVYISWSSCSGGHYYLVYRNTTNNSETAIALGSWQTDLNYSDNTAAAGQVYYYWVKAAVNSSGDHPSEFSVSNAGYTQYSGCFVEIQVPYGGESWAAGSSHTITWTDNIPENVKIELYNNGSFHSSIAESVESDGSHPWTIPSGQALGNTYQIKISSISTPSCFDISENFSIIEAGTFTCGESLIDNRDSQSYNTVLIGEQCWMAENMNVGTRINSTQGGYQQQDNETIEKYCYNNDEANCDIYGGLYEWPEAMQYLTTEGAQGICPPGWHIPSDGEWTVLSDYLEGWLVAGGKMKSTGTIEESTGLWYAPNTSATNESGFTGLPGGSRNYDGGSFNGRGLDGIFWSSTEGNEAVALDRELNWSAAYLGPSFRIKTYGFSVRCLKDEEVQSGLPCPGIPTVTYEGQTYNTVQIGDQCWMAENLNIGSRIDGTYEQTENEVIEKYCYNDQEVNCDIYGGLYQWNEAMQYVTDEGSQGICPEGWHIPTGEEWTTLTDYFLGGESIAGGKMKSTGTIEEGTGLWHTPNTGATNETGFAGLPGGNRIGLGGNFANLGGYGWFWSSTKGIAADAWYRGLDYLYTYVYRNHGNEVFGFSIRCLKDTEPETGLPCPGIPTVTYEGQTYNTVQIGDQCWLKENLNVGLKINSNSWGIHQFNNDTIEKYCYDNDIANCDIYGGLYEWSEAMNWEGIEGAQGICPDRWHIPTGGEWAILRDFLGGETLAGGKMKSAGTIEEGTGLWYSPNTAATNESGFAALPGGYRPWAFGYFGSLGYNAEFWSSSGAYDVFYLIISSASSNLLGYYGFNGNGLSIRCIKNLDSDDLTLSNDIISSGEDECFQAANTITVAGSGTTYIIQDDGELTLVAGNKILLKPGFHAQPGSYFHAYIGDEGCEEPLKPANIFSAEQDQLEETIIEQALGIDETTSTEYLKVYPNPTTGEVTIEINSQDSDELNTIWVYDFHGRLIQQQKMIGSGKKELDLSAHPHGMYLIRAIHGDKSETVKVVKQY